MPAKEEESTFLWGLFASFLSERQTQTVSAAGSLLKLLQQQEPDKTDQDPGTQASLQNG